MSRPRGSKNRPKTEGNGAAPATGHNSGELNDDERRALTLHHKRLYEAATERIEAAKAERTQIAELAKADLGKGVIGEIKDMISLAEPKKLSGFLERSMRLARWLGAPIGYQAHMFEPVTDHHEEGKTAGMQGETCQPPKHLAAMSADRWIQGWHEGQAVLASAFKKRKQDVPAASADADTSDRPFGAPDEEHAAA